MSFLNSAAKSQAPDRPIGSVSSSEYRRIPRGPKLTTFLDQKLIFLSPQWDFRCFLGDVLDVLVFIFIFSIVLIFLGFLGFLEAWDV